MDFDFDTGSIYGGLQTLDVTTLPPLGGTAGVLSLVGNGAVTLLQGTTLERPGTALAGMFRYNTDTDTLEYYNGVTWSTLAVGGGTVTSVDATSSTPALTVTGGPITSSGTFTFDLDADLTAIAALSGTGLSVRTGAGTWATRTITGTAGNIVVTNGDGVSANPTIDLATVSQANTGDFVKVTLDGFGRVTGNTAVVQSDITTLVDSVYVNVAGDTMSSGANLTFTGGGEVLGLPQTPSADDAAASKYYVDAVASGLSWKQAVRLATTVDIDLSTGGMMMIDGVNTNAGDRILVKNQTNPDENGIYIARLTAWTRATDMDSTTPINEINGAAVFVTEGALYENTGWTQYENVTTLGTDPINWAQFSGAGSYTGGNGINVSGNIISLIAPVTVANGGTGLTTAPANGQLLIGNGTGYTLSTLTDGTGINITEGAGTITIANTGVTSITGTANQITASASTGAVTLSIPSNFVAPGSVTVTTDLLVSTLTPNSALYAGAAGQIFSTAALTDGQILIGDTGGAPVPGTITGGTGVTVTNGAGTITIDIDDTEVVTSFSAGTTGLTPSSPTSGDIVLGGTLATTNGGTGLTTIGTANQFLAVDTAGTALEYKTVAAGTGISVTPGVGVLTIANTGVTSFTQTVPSFLSITGATAATGAVNAPITLVTQTANTVFAGPASGAPTVPSFRGLVYDDVLSAIQLYRENPSTPTTPVATGANAQAFGDGSSATIFGSKAFANGIFATAGDAQSGMYVLRNETTNNTATALFLDGTAGTQRLVVGNNSVWTFDILVTARRTDATGGGAGYRFVGVIRKDATAGSTTFVGTPSKTVIGETDGAWDAAVTANTTNGDLRVTVTGQNAKTIRWVAVVQTAEVTN